MPSNRHIDLHIHSTYSDGLLHPAEIVTYASRFGLNAIAITDHDDFSGFAEAAAAGARLGLEVIPGIELSAIHDGYETHILGYLYDVTSAPLLEFAARMRASRVERAEEIVQRLRHLGMPISMEMVKMRAGQGALGRPHIADILVEEGYVFSFNEAFHKWLGENKPGYVPKMKLMAEEAIALVHNSGGLAFLAHPGTGTGIDAIEALIEMGLDGIETLHPRHVPEMITYYRELARRNGLLETGGSDCHGARRGEMMIGTQAVPYAFLNEMRLHRSLTGFPESA
ncbi:MAG TPA: PHP domain-containing protein [bacterium]|nr:PHP domain-containing protein [bacterium]HQG44196.1 PHP domain-containing protein [bacterium]HQI47883.1 PHP domain-containing protein [bacterium]HQJ66201.1 PHP domain-containing protein [bacterium]